MLKFLVIDDDEPIRVLLKHTLKKNFPCLVLEACNGAEGVQIAQNTIPNLILLDIMMPVMDGRETLQKMRENALLRKTPVLIMTATNDKEVVGTLVKLGICDYILKPVDTQDAVIRIKKILDKERTRLRKTMASTSEFYSDIPKVLLVEPESTFKEQFNTFYSERLTIYDAKTGKEAFESYIRNRPKFILVSDKVGLLDKKIITQKIREAAHDNDVQIILLASETKAFSNNAFAFDTVLKRNNNIEEFVAEFEKIIFGEEINKQENAAG